MFQKKELGQALCDQVFYSLDLIEKDYFGLQYTDHNHVQVGHTVTHGLSLSADLHLNTQLTHSSGC